MECVMPKPQEQTTLVGGISRVPSREEFRTSVLENALLIAGLIIPTVVTAVYFVGLGGAAAIWQQLAYGVGKGIQFLLPVAWRATMPKAKSNHANIGFGT